MPTSADHALRPVWRNPTNPVSPPNNRLDTVIRADLCVVGLGASGLSAILEARRLGLTVVGVDANVIAGGAAGANGGILRAGLSKFHHEAVSAFGREPAAALYRLSAAEIDRVAEETPEAVTRTGSLRVAADDAEWADVAAQMRSLRDDGIEAEERETTFGRGIYIPHDASVHPVARVHALARACSTEGALLFEQTPALHISGSEVHSPGGRISCGAVIVAVDGGLEQAVPALGGIVRTTRLQMLATAPATDVSIPCPVSASFGFDYFRQLPDGRVALGGGRNRSFDTEWGAPAEPSTVVQSYLDGVLRSRIRTQAPVTHRWAAQVSYTSTGLPVMREVEPRVWAIGAYCGTGNLVGSLCGRSVARLIAGTDDGLRALVDPAPRAC
ncbi:MAG: FAD-binding oxidoreductase [Gemmatimonadetes bacterium]|nr:FAD-binding oxidoreductase [Gemmatimonadota bacterium]